jgi:hypothetical protein
MRLYYFNARYYDPENGVFISPDPAMDGLNHYVYARGNPLMFTDMMGLYVDEFDPDEYNIEQDPFAQYGLDYYYDYGYYTSYDQSFDYQLSASEEFYTGDTGAFFSMDNVDAVDNRESVVRCPLCPDGPHCPLSLAALATHRATSSALLQR